MVTEEAKTKCEENKAKQAEAAEEERKLKRRGRRRADQWVTKKMSSIDWNVVQI